MMLGGVEIPSERGLLGHSDADVLLHAIADALLGAAALRDIGYHFSDKDPRWEGADSGKLLQAVVGMVREQGYTIGNVDAIVIAEVPRLSPYIDSIRERIARLLEVAPEQVSVKATTSERLGFVGHEEGMVAQAVALIVRDESNC